MNTTINKYKLIRDNLINLEQLILGKSKVKIDNNEYMKDFTILLQGRINKECLELWIENHKDTKVVLSVWEDEILDEYKFPKNWTIVVNQYPLVRFWKQANLDYQIMTTLRGLYKVDTKWCIKLRADEYWSNLDNVYTKMTDNPNKIVTGSMFFRKWGMYPFHCSDKILGGTLDNLIAMFESTLHNIEINYYNSNIPECQLGVGWLMVNEPNTNFKGYFDNVQKRKFDQNSSFKAINKAAEIITKEIMDIVVNEFNRVKSGGIDWKLIKSKLIRCKDILVDITHSINLDDEIQKDVIDEKAIMRKWFEIIDINELKPYIATRNFGTDSKQGRVWYRDDFDHIENECLTDINQN